MFMPTIRSSRHSDEESVSTCRHTFMGFPEPPSQPVTVHSVCVCARVCFIIRRGSMRCLDGMKWG